MPNDATIVRNTPRFIFVSDQRVVSSWHEAPTREDVRIGWRMIAGNNRPMARSIRTFSTLADCAEHARTLCDRVDELTSAVLFNEADARWWWTVRCDEEVVAKCAVPAKRRIEAVRAVGQFLDVLRNAPQSPLVVRHLGVYAHGRASSDQGTFPSAQQCDEGARG